MPLAPFLYVLIAFHVYFNNNALRIKGFQWGFDNKKYLIMNLLMTQHYMWMGKNRICVIINVWCVNVEIRGGTLMFREISLVIGFCLLLLIQNMYGMGHSFILRS